ncbi:MAG: histidine kinase [Elainellaceae cyanobacterium]
MTALPSPHTNNPPSTAVPTSKLHLLLFVDRRPQSSERIRKIRHYLKHHPDSDRCQLRVIDIGEQPHLAEHFRLVATPALIKTSPKPRQTIAGTNLVEQLETWWPRWLQSAENGSAENGTAEKDHAQAAQDTASLANEAEIIRLSDEIFRISQEKADLEAQLQFKDRLIAMLAHDLRNPLTALSIALETLEMGFEAGKGISMLKPELQAQILHHGRTQTKAIDRMITDILQVARGSHARFQINPLPLDFIHLLTDSLDRLKRQFHGKAQQVETDLPTDLPQVHADPELVRQLVIHLLDNATKYTPHGGTITVSALHRTTQKIQVSICDTGPGIPEENQQRIFEDRFRLKRDESTDGYGIGLSLCQRIVRAHYGQIWVDSDANQGSCFHFTLPVYR